MEVVKLKQRKHKKSNNINVESINIKTMSNIDIEKLTTRQLRTFIKRASEIMDLGRNSENVQLQKAYRIKSEQLGVRILNGKIIKGYSGLSKRKLIERAKSFQSYLRIDVFTNEAAEGFREIDDDLKDKINKKLGVEFDDEEMYAFWFLMHEVKSSMKEFDSADVASLLETGIEEDVEAIDLAQIIKEEYQNVTGGGLDKKKFISRVKNRLKEML